MSRIKGFHKLSISQRRNELINLTNLPTDVFSHLSEPDDELVITADQLAENVIATFQMPLGIATNMIVDDEPVLVPMVSEESSVIAAVCHHAAPLDLAGQQFWVVVRLSYSPFIAASSAVGEY